MTNGRLRTGPSSKPSTATKFLLRRSVSDEYMDEWRIGEHAYTLDGRRVALVSHETVEEAVRHYKLTGQKGVRTTSPTAC